KYTSFLLHYILRTRPLHLTSRFPAAPRPSLYRQPIARNRTLPAATAADIGHQLQREREWSSDSHSELRKAGKFRLKA
ncbi:hypothetical protein FOCC_FOCC017368, partial [Frankliniella occidentalis]